MTTTEPDIPDDEPGARRTFGPDQEQPEQPAAHPGHAEHAEKTTKKT
jgi:hypothetical protein